MRTRSNAVDSRRHSCSGVGGVSGLISVSGFSGTRVGGTTPSARARQLLLRRHSISEGIGFGLGVSSSSSSSSSDDDDCDDRDDRSGQPPPNAPEHNPRAAAATKTTATASAAASSAAASVSAVASAGAGMGAAVASCCAALSSARVDLRCSTFFDRAYPHDSPAVAAVRAYVSLHLRAHLPDVIAHIALDALVWELQPGSLVDALGTTAGLNMFFPASGRWDVCVVLAVTHSAVHIRPIDRVHPYPYLYPHYTKPSEWVSITSDRLAPYLSRVLRCEPRDAREYDLIDLRSAETGQWHCAEVCANIGSALWVLAVDNYSSAEYKDARREWVSASATDRLARYRSRAPQQPQMLAGGRAADTDADADADTNALTTACKPDRTLQLPLQHVMALRRDDSAGAFSAADAAALSAAHVLNANSPGVAPRDPLWVQVTDRFGYAAVCRPVRVRGFHPPAPLPHARPFVMHLSAL